ncbi:hypothetical protein RJ55_04636 [Drechmeria coniospora]|nr:hypothetical protein RJ55_04636 [Drechmeria coniospora]
MKWSTALRRKQRHLHFIPTFTASASLGPPTTRMQQRWTSYDRAALTKKDLLRQAEAGLGDDCDGKRMRIDAEAKLLSTAAGPLPISPLFDPAWMKARRRQRKDRPGKPMGRFRRKLANNPFALALATPMRRCANTTTSLPRYFLQDFELVSHPDTGAAWWAPGPLSFELVQQTSRTARVAEEDEVDEAPPATDSTTNTSFGVNGSAVPGRKSHESQPQAVDNDEDTGSTPKRPYRSPVTSYTLCRKSLVDSLGGPSKKNAALLLAGRTGMAVAPEMRNSVWRADMGEVLLGMMRRHVVNALVVLSQARPGEEERVGNRLVHPCASWEAAKDVKLRGCLLRLPKHQSPDETGGGYATLDIHEAQYGRKMMVYDLDWLLGDTEVTRLRQEAPPFGQHELFVLKQWNSLRVMRLHLLLWRLQGYLAP